MLKKPETPKQKNFRFTFEELAGAVGNFGTVLPILLGVAIVSDVNAGYIFLFLSLAYIISGLYFKLPMPVEPMKAVGAIVIAENLSHEQIAASGIILGVLFLILGYLKGLNFLQKNIPQSVIRGIQLGLTLVLIKVSLGFIIWDLIIALICIGVIVLFFLLNKYRKVPNIGSLVVIAFGVVYGIVRNGLPEAELIDAPLLILPSLQDFYTSAWRVALPQAPLTLTNAILAISLLYFDIFQKNVTPDKLAKSTGIMNLLSTPFGGFPMCHGAGGLAAHYRFGARTGGSNIICGLILLPLALWFSGPDFILLIPSGVFGALLIFVALELGKHAFKTSSFPLTIIIAVLAFLTNFAIAFIAGLALHFLIKYLSKTKSS
ncbi:MAG: sulfate transporter [Bacteroidetes bacterium]|nr:MAG: sulfate transporter [Bacteroidota bacterium]